MLHTKAADRLILCDGRIKGWKEGQLHEMNRKNWDIPKLRPHYSKLTGWHCSEFLHVLHKAVNSCVHCVPPENIDQSYVSFSTSSVDLTAKNVINQHKAYFPLPVGKITGSLLERKVIRSGLLTSVKFETDWTIYTQFTTTSCFMANNISSWHGCPHMGRITC